MASPGDPPPPHPPPPPSSLSPAWFCQPRHPLLSGRETPAQKTFPPVQLAALVQFGEEGTPQAQPDALLLPETKPSPTDAGTDAKVFWQIAPTRAGFEYPENAFKDWAVVF